MINKEKIRINLLFEQFLLPNQIYISDMVRELSMDKRLDINIFALKKSLASNLKISFFPNYYFRRVYERGYALLNNSYRNLSYIEINSLKNNVDIIHVHHSFLFKHVKNILDINKANRPKVVITLRGSDTYVKPWYDKRWQNFYKEYGNKVDAFILQSNHQKKYLKQWGVNSDRMYKISSSIREFESKGKQIKSDKIRILSSFRMSWEKNIDGNIRVIRTLLDKGLNVYYDIYGYGHDIGQLYYLIDYHNLQNNVNIMGKVDNRTYKENLKNYDFYLQLSLSESLSISAIEAQAHGIPCIISNAGGMPETIINEESGFTLDYFDIEKAADKIIDLANNNEKYFSFSSAAINHVKNSFVNAIEVQKHLELYKSLLGRDDE